MAPMVDGGTGTIGASGVDKGDLLEDATTRQGRTRPKPWHPP